MTWFQALVVVLTVAAPVAVFIIGLSAMLALVLSDERWVRWCGYLGIGALCVLAITTLVWGASQS